MIEIPENLRKKCIHLALEKKFRGSLSVKEADEYRSEIQKSGENGY